MTSDSLFLVVEVSEVLVVEEPVVEEPVVEEHVVEEPVVEHPLPVTSQSQRNTKKLIVHDEEHHPFILSKDYTYINFFVSNRIV
jgi:hypothetical protein